MGRPLNKKYLGNPNDKPGRQVLITDAWIPGAPQAATKNSVYIVKQISKVRFVVSDGTHTGIINLQQEPVTAEGQGRITVNPCVGFVDYPVTVDSGIPSTMTPAAEEHVFQLNNRTLKTLEGNNFRWFPEPTDCHNGDVKCPLFENIPTP